MLQDCGVESWSSGLRVCVVCFGPLCVAGLVVDSNIFLNSGTLFWLLTFFHPGKPLNNSLAIIGAALGHPLLSFVQVWLVSRSGAPGLSAALIHESKAPTHLIGLFGTRFSRVGFVFNLFSASTASVFPFFPTTLTNEQFAMATGYHPNRQQQARSELVDILLKNAFNMDVDKAIAPSHPMEAALG